MAEMSINKVIHGAVRRDLSRFEAALGAFADGDTARAADLQRAWLNFDKQLTHHHEGEQEIAWPALRAIGVAEEDITRFDDEHDAMAAALSESGATFAALASSGSRADADVAAESLVGLKAATLPHLASEEDFLEPLYAENKEHSAFKGMDKKFGRAQSIGNAGVFLAWIQHGASADELAALKAGIPGPVLAILTKVFGRRYTKEIAPVWS